MPIEAADGVIDSLRESFHLHLEHVTAGEHVIVIRAMEDAGWCESESKSDPGHFSYGGCH